MPGWLPLVVGLVAGALSTSAFVPQVVKCWRTRETGAISKRMFILRVVGFGLWVGYGAALGSWPLIIINTLNLISGSIILWLKIKGDPAPCDREAVIAPAAERG